MASRAPCDMPTSTARSMRGRIQQRGEVIHVAMDIRQALRQPETATIEAQHRECGASSAASRIPVSQDPAPSHAAAQPRGLLLEAASAAARRAFEDDLAA